MAIVRWYNCIRDLDVYVNYQRAGDTPNLYIVDRDHKLIENSLEALKDDLSGTVRHFLTTISLRKRSLIVEL